MRPLHIRCGFALLLGACCAAAPAATPAAPQPVRLAVFDFELEDVSASAAPAGTNAADAARLKAVSERVRQTLSQSGRYVLVDTAAADAAEVKAASLHGCSGCEAGIALRLGAEQSLLGVVTRVEKTSYMVRVQISDAKTGKILDQQSAAFLGGDEGWASGAASLVRHRVLSGDYPVTCAENCGH
jgi:hypothetical protein